MSDFGAPQSRNEAILQNILGAENELPDPQSNIEKLLQAILYEDETIVDFEPASRTELLLYAILTNGEYTAEPQSRNEAILKAILTRGEYDALPQSRIEELLLDWLDQRHVYVKTVSGPVAHVTDAIAAPAVDVTVQIVPYQSGTGDPSPENIRPISGWTGANVARTGKNLLSTPYYSPSGTRNGVDFTINSDGSITLSASSATTKVSNFNLKADNSQSGLKAGEYKILCRGASSNVNLVYGGLQSNIEYGSLTDDNAATIILTNTNETLGFCIIQAKVGFVGVTTVYPMIVTSDTTDLSYSPYHGNTYPVTWQSEAGTVYGGTLDLTTGKLTATYGEIASYDGETLPGKWISDRDVYVEGATPTTGAQVVYELATPIEYQLTPTEIELFLGVNNVWADTGDTALTYKGTEPPAASLSTAGMHGLQQLGGLSMPGVIRPEIEITADAEPEEADGTEAETEAETEENEPEGNDDER